MKIKSVKITGFRAFEKEEDSTFDFTKNGEIMNFASIYAPNGFGKTSFYDAVEWGITRKIQRFDRMVDFEKVRKENEGPLLLNKSSLSGKVIIETSSQKFENIINKKKVYKYNERPANEYFQNQILTQDLIDTFLKEEKADKRYENFLEIDENLKKYDLAYKKINRLLEYIKEERKGLTGKKKDEESKLQGEIDFKQELKKFDEINEVIRSLNKENENLEPIDPNTFNQTSYDNLSWNAEVRLTSLEEEFNKTKLRIDTIVLARDGEESDDGKLSGGIISYLDNKDKISKFDDQLTELNQIVKLIEEQERVVNGSRVNDENIKTQQNRLERALNIEKRFETFLSIQKEINILQKSITEYKEIFLKIEHDKLEIEKKINDATIKINELKNSLETNQSKLNSIPTQQKQLELTSQTIIDIKKTIVHLSESIAAEEKKLGDVKLVLDEFEYYEGKINDDIEILLEFNLFDEHKKLIIDHISQKENIEKLKISLQEVQYKIDQQNDFNKELNKFVNLGLELVNKSQSSDCPLCNQGYTSFEKLSENILSNKLLDLQVKTLLEEKVKLESKISELTSKLTIDKEIIEKTFSSIKQPYSLDQRNIKNAISRFDSEKAASLEKLNSNQSVLNDINLSLGDFKTFEDLSNKLKEELSKSDSQILELSRQITKNVDALSEKEILAKSTKEKLDISERNLIRCQSSNEHKQVKKYFIEELKSNQFEKVILSEAIAAIRHKINELIEKKESFIESLADLKERLVNHTLSKDEYVGRIERAINARNLIQRVYDSYENFIKSEFGVVLRDKNKTQIEKAFIDLIETQKEFEKQVLSKIEKYKIVKILNEACIKAAESKKVEDRIKEIAKTLKELVNSEKVLNEEKENLKKYLKSTIESYFYTRLINAIYEKIDPHPDYKSIEFKCDFAENKPRLQIYTLSMNDKGEEVWSVPSLYFSTAQVNILSLSIFLARALKTKDNQKNPVDCIFIDDPIQSMDSINILSFIDLFRGITLSLDKQLIVSTHEENFHLLLQKKIPSELFKSKFIEFETFGKLRNTAV